MQGKSSYERYAYEHGVTVNIHHVDNELFADKFFVDSCFDKYQKLSFYGRGAHFQNRNVKNQIKYLSNKGIPHLSTLNTDGHK